MKHILPFFTLMLAALSIMAQNPVSNAIYTPDPAPFVYGDKVYLFTDHDEDDATYFLMKDWLVFCTEDMVNWTYLGAQVSTATFAWAKQGDRAWAGQAIERGGKWYWYVCCNTVEGGDAIAVAVADSPTGPWKDAVGAPLAVGFGYIDPSVFIDDDGTAWLFWGNKGLWYGQLNDDMVSFKDGWREVPGYHEPECFGELQMKMNWAVGHDESMTQYEEGPWVYKRNGTYYLSYPAGGVPEYMGYSTAPTINGPWTFRGRIMDEAVNSFTIHGGNIDFKGHSYMFYHNGILPNGGGFHRSAAVEEFHFNADGTIPFIPFTNEGVEPTGTLNPYTTVEAETMASSWGVKLDRLDSTHHYVTSIHNGDWIKVREVDFGMQEPGLAAMRILNFKNEGKVEFYLDELGGKPIVSIDVTGDSPLKTAPVRPGISGKHDLYILFRGGDEELFDADWWKFISSGGAPVAQQSLYENEFPLGDVKLLDGVLKDARNLNIKTLLQYDCDRLLAPFRIEAGLEPKAPLYPNWAGLDGHIGGHYLSAMAMNAATGDEECLRRMDYMLSELAECMEAGDRNNASWGIGYLGGIPGSGQIWSAFRDGDFGPYFAAWVPFYNIHKIFAGLRDAWIYAGRENAKAMFLRCCDWTLFITEKLSDAQMEKILGHEHGGMSEVLADAYAISGNQKYLECAKRFAHRFILDPMASRVDMLDNLHANTQVPKAVGFERIYQLGGGEKFHDAGLFFWETVTGSRSLAFGGNSRREHFPTVETSVDYVNDIDGAESCNTYNMLKLTEDLFRTSPQQRFAEYYERATFNHILSSQHPGHGGYVYFTSCRPRHYRNYSAPNQAMWCCVGTGMENHGKYGQFIYTKSEDTLYVNLFVPSELEWKERTISLRQETAFPYSESSSIKITAGEGRFKLMLRHPSWVRDGEYAVKVNGRSVKTDGRSGSYVCLYRNWKKGDVVEVEFPMANRVEHLPNVPEYVALMHGPILLAMKTGTEDLKQLVADDSRFGQLASGMKLPIDEAPFFICDDVEKIADDIVPIDGKPLHFTIKTHIENPIAGELQPFFEIHDARYMMYWLAFDKNGYQDYMKKLAESEAVKTALESRTVDKVQPGEQQPEADHRMESDGSVSGNTDGVFFRDASDGGSFSYLMQTNGENGLSVMIKYWGQDEWKTCEYDLYADDVLVKSVNNTRKWRTSQWKTESYPIPSDALKGKKEVRIKFVAKPGKQVGGIYGVRLVRNAEK